MHVLMEDYMISEVKRPLLQCRKSPQKKRGSGNKEFLLFKHFHHYVSIIGCDMDDSTWMLGSNIIPALD